MDTAKQAFGEEFPRAPAPGDITFSETAGRGFYEQIEDAIAHGDEEPLIDFSRMPKDWSPTPTPTRNKRH